MKASPHLGLAEMKFLPAALRGWRNLPAGRQVADALLKIFSMEYCVYVLRSLSKNYRYIGMTSDFERRFYEHSGGFSKSTKGYRPLEVLRKEYFPTRLAAHEREVYLKSGIGREYLDNLELSLNTNKNLV